MAQSRVYRLADSSLVPTAAPRRRRAPRKTPPAIWVRPFVGKARRYTRTLVIGFSIVVSGVMVAHYFPNVGHLPLLFVEVIQWMGMHAVFENCEDWLDVVARGQ